MKQISTKQYFEESLRELCSLKSFDNISVRDIADNCGMSTRTFYNHFRDKQDLVLWMFTSKFETYISTNPSFNIVVLYKYLEEIMLNDREMYINIMESEFFGENYFNDVITYLQNRTIQYIKDNSKMKEVSGEILFGIEFFYQGGFHLGYKYLKGELNLSKEEYLNYLISSMPSVLRFYLLDGKECNEISRIEECLKKRCM